MAAPGALALLCSARVQELASLSALAAFDRNRIGATLGILGGVSAPMSIPVERPTASNLLTPVSFVTWI